MIGIHVHFYSASGSSPTALGSYCNKVNPKRGTGYKYMPDTLNYGPRGRLQHFAL